MHSSGSVALNRSDGDKVEETLEQLREEWRDLGHLLQKAPVLKGATWFCDLGMFCFLRFGA